LIQGFENFTVSAGDVEATWRLPLRRIVVSRWLLGEMERRGLDAALIENGVDRETFKPATSHTPPAGVLAMVSDHKYKRTDLVVEVYRRLSRDHPNLPLRTFGACSRPAGLPSEAEHVSEPNRAELAALYRRSAVYVCASDKEGFGLPALEAMSSGCAVVTTDNGGVPAFAGEAALTVPAGSAEHLYRGVALLIADPEAHARYREAGLTRAAQLDAVQSCDKLEAMIVDGWRSGGL
jgi:glycosyltransferase involved in cell wall biosynthesis